LCNSNVLWFYPVKEYEDMSEQLAELQRGYLAIMTKDDYATPYADYEQHLRSLRFADGQALFEELVATCGQSSVVLEAMDRTRQWSPGGTPYFRGEGALIVGDARKIIGAQYDSETIYSDGRNGDLDGERMTACKHDVLFQLGRAALLKRVQDESPMSFGPAYTHIERLMVREGLKLPYTGLVRRSASDAPHPLGYAATSRLKGNLVAGAAGMVPTAATSAAMRYAYNISTDYAAGLVTNESDEFKGYHDYVAASAVLEYLISDGVDTRPAPVLTLRNAGVNLH
jgi:hypothetical protein